MWQALTEDEEAGRVTRYTLRRGEALLSREGVLHAWQHDAAFRRFFSATLAATRWHACFWEMPPLDRASMALPFEFVLVDSPALAAARADAGPFRHVFGDAGEGQQVVSFPNLGQDALLIAPLPIASREHYPHLAAFVRGAPAAQQHALWQAVGRAAAARLGADPLWISTSGLGVYWLHVRLDSTPKYYTYSPYRSGGKPRHA